MHDVVSYLSSPLTVKDVEKNGEYNLYDANKRIGKTNRFMIPSDYITVIKDGAGVGRIRKLPKNTAFIGTMGALVPQHSNIDFIYNMINNKDLSGQFSGSTIPHIYFKDYGNDEYLMPTLSEQLLIGKYFNELDSSITLHQ